MTVVVGWVVSVRRALGILLSQRSVMVPRSTTPRTFGQRPPACAPESVVIIGDSRGWFDLDLDELQKGLG